MRSGTNCTSAVGIVTDHISIAVITNDSVALVCERTIPKERPPFVGEISANFCG
jgi:hypothetical protein